MIDLTVDEMRRILDRNRFSMQVLAERVGVLTLENVELMSIVNELQTDLSEARQVLSDLQLSTELESDHAVVHSVSDEQPVPSG